MNCYAIQMGWMLDKLLASGPHAAKVHSVFDRVLNMELTGSALPDDLVSIGDSDVPPSPVMLTVDGVKSWKSYTREGETVGLQQNRIVFPSFSVTIPPSTPVWRMMAAERMAACPRLTAAQISRRLDDLSNRYKVDRRMFATAMNHGMDAFATWAQGAIDGAPFSPDTAVAGLIGLGPGLTPSGDDFLAGLMFGLHAAGRFNGTDSCLTAPLQEGILGQCGKTNRISGHFLRYAAAGLWGKTEEDCIVSICSCGDYGQSASRLASLGSTSGKDTLQGIVTGLRLAILEGLFQ